jgi:hypothetical protein
MINLCIEIHLKTIVLRSSQRVPRMSPFLPRIIGRVSPN